MAKSLAKAYLKARGVKLVDEDRIVLRCKTCGQQWSPNLDKGGKLPRRFWACPNGCNRDL